uniref:Uncharacterized protein n=1 Tax=Neovison vison TaxID=452646 RepID=A0A8C7AFF6_NEOVI
MLAISFISAVNRKRKKRREARGLGSSTDDDSEQEVHKPEAPAPGARDQPEGPLPGAADAPEAWARPRPLIGPSRPRASLQAQAVSKENKSGFYPLPYPTRVSLQHGMGFLQCRGARGASAHLQAASDEPSILQEEQVTFIQEKLGESPEAG